MRATFATRLTVGVFGTVLLLLGLGLLAIGAASLREVRVGLVEATSHVGATVATYSAADLAFGADDESRQRLARLTAIPEVHTAALYDDEGRLFSAYVREGFAEADAVPPVVAPAPDRSAVVTRDHVVVVEPVIHDGHRYGTLYLRASTARLDLHLRAIVTRGLIVAGALLALAVMVATALHRLLTRPLVQLAGVARVVSTGQDCSVRAPPSVGEIGVLADGFNAMLDALELRAARQAEAEAGQRHNARRLELIHLAERAVLAGAPPDTVVAATLGRMAQLVEVVGAVVLSREGDDEVRVVPGVGDLPSPGARYRWAPALAVSATLAPTDGGVPPWLRELCVGSSTSLIVRPLRAEQLFGALVVGARPDRVVGVTEVANDVAEVLTLAMRQGRLADEIADHTRNLEELVSERTAALQASLSEIEAFGYTVAHDLRAPLRAIQGFATALEEEVGRSIDTSAREHLERIRAASVRMDLLIRDLLDYTSLVVQPLGPAEADLAPLVAAALGSLEPLLSARGGRVVVREPLGRVLAHPPTLTRMIANLLDNALKYVADGVSPEVVVSADLGERTVVLRVEDNGVGIDPRHRDRIFKVFERLDRTGTGTGIGLAIVKKGAERMQGAVGVEPRAGGGSRFWVELPRAPD